MARYDDLQRPLKMDTRLSKAGYTNTASPITGRSLKTPQHSELETRFHHGDRAHRDPTIHGRARQQEAAAASRGYQLLKKRPYEEERVDREGSEGPEFADKRAACNCLDAAAAAGTYDDNDFFGLQHSIGASRRAEIRGIHLNTVFQLMQ